MTVSLLGIDTTTQQRVEISQSSRREGFYLLGATGTGKSTLLQNLILQDIRDNVGVCVLDPHGDLVKGVVSRMQKRFDDVIFVDLSSRKYVAGLNLFHCEHPDDPFEAENVVQAVMHILEKVYDISRGTPQMNQYYINIINTLLYNPQATVLDIQRLLTDQAFRASLLANVPDEHIRWFWNVFFENRQRLRRDDEIASTVNKLVDFTGRVLKPWFGLPTPTLNMREIMDQGKILLVTLNAQWSTINSLLGSIFIAQILDAAYSRADTKKKSRRQFNVYADEFQRFATQDFATLFTESRKYGIGITIAHQVLEQLDPSIKATIKQAANISVFRVSSDNAKEIAGTFDCSPLPGPTHLEPLKTPVTQPIEFLTQPSRGVYVGQATEAFITTYGRGFVESANQEKEIQRDSLHENQRYDHDLAAGVRYIAPPNIEVSYDSRLALSFLDGLFHAAMIAGKKHEDVDAILIPDEGLEAILKARGYGMAYKTYLGAYESLTTTMGIQVVNHTDRVLELQNKLAELPAQEYHTLLPYQTAVARAKERLLPAFIAYLRRGMETARRYYAIVRTAGFFDTYLVAKLHQSSDYVPYEHYEICYVDYSEYDTFATWKEAAQHLYDRLQYFKNYQNATTSAWYHVVQDTFYNKSCWDEGEATVWFQEGSHYGGGHTENLEIWVLQKGIEKTWYTEGQLRDMAKVLYAEYTKTDNAIYTSPFTEKKEKLDRFQFVFCFQESYQDSLAVKTYNRKEHDLRMHEGEIKRRFAQEKQIIEKELPLLTGLLASKPELDSIKEELREQIREVMRELAQSPVEADSGLQQEVPGSEVPSSEVELRIANQIKQLPKFTARVRLETGEYTIHTSDTAKQLEAGGDNKKKTVFLTDAGLQERIELIQEKNCQQGYLRLRSDVEAELRKRQEPDDPPTNPVPNRPTPPTQPSNNMAKPPLPNRQQPTSRKRKLSDHSTSP